MRILIVHNILNDSVSVSGVLKHYAFMANEWIAAGHPTDFVVAKAGFAQLRQLAPEAGLLSSDGIFDATKNLSKTWQNMPAFLYRMWNAHWLRLREKYDVVYASGPFIFEVYAARVLARRLRAKWVAKVQHVLHSQPKRNGLFNRMFLHSERVSTRWMNRRAAAVMCLSKVVQDDYRKLEIELGLTPSKSIQVGCGIDCAAMIDGREEKKEFDVVMLGRIHEQKGVFEIPGIWKDVLDKRPEARLLIIGSGPHRAAMEEKFKALGVADSVTCAGSVGETKKNELLARSRVGLSLSYEEGWGLSVTEFLASALPVVAYRLPVFEQVFPDQLELIAPGDSAAAANEIVALLNDDDRRLERGSAGREFAGKYDFREIAKEELQILQRVLNEA
jgi:glycosyltransferase involved in cell wall biosynthesis